MSDTLAIKGGTPVRTRPFHGWPVHGEEERRAVLEVVESGRWSWNGPKEEAFSRAFARFCGAKEAFCVANGTVSLEIALHALGVGPGDEVIVPALTWMATALAVVNVGATPVFADARRDDACVDPEAVRRLITPRTRAVIPVHLYSQLADLDALAAIAARHGVALVEDCAHVVGARWGDRGVGTVGAIGSFSFQQSKGMTSGEGGALVTSDEALAHRIFGGKNCGRPWKPGAPATFGGNHRITEMQAAILLAQLGRLEGQLRAKAENVARLARALAGVQGVDVLPIKPQVTRLGLYGLLLRFDAGGFEGLPRDTALAALRAEGIPVATSYDVVYRSPLWIGGAEHRAFGRGASARERLGLDARCPVAERIAAEESLVIPHEVFLGPPADMDDIAAAFEKVRRLAPRLALDGLRSRAKDLVRRALR
ncbi:DegT/DnrJ/EryC1/StrS family aminotransferase [Sorangium sp. So ce854]|uniref:DegT/DnrJ/EryC1/StrS family aminotransferase n=1 Tax=Sorangium sp. So ce854 TaxID=3133322 RepID=UPI003F60D4AB